MKKIFLIGLLSIMIISCHSQNCDGLKQKKLCKVFPKAEWINNINLLVKWDIIESIDYNDKELNELYNVIIDSACNYFSDDEIEMIIEKDFKNENIKSELNKKLLEFIKIAGKAGGLWAKEKCIRKFGYQYSEGIDAFYCGNYEKSLAYFEQQTNENKDSTYQNFLFLGKSFSALDKTNEAIKAFKKAIEIDPEKSETYYDLANTYLYKVGDKDSSLKIIRKALEIDPTDIYYKILLGDIYCGSNDFENGIKEYSNILSNDINNILALNSRALAYYFSGREASALQDYRNVLLLDSINKDALLGLGNLFIKQKVFDSAKFFLDKAIGNYPNNNVGYSYLAGMYFVLKDFKESVKYYSISIDLKNDFNDRTSRGFAYIELGDYEKAKADFNFIISNAKKSIYNNTSIAYAYNNLGLIEYKLGHYDTGLIYVKKSIELLPGNPYAFRNQALIYLSKNEIDKACEALQMAKDLRFADFYGDEVDNLLNKNCK